jgi:putative flippase GtrA
MNKDFKQIIIFILIGGGAALLTMLLTYLGLNRFPKIPKPIITACVYAFMILPVYFLQHKFSFEGKSNHKDSLPKYIGVQMVSVTISFILSYLFLDILNLPHALGAIIVVATTSIGSFVALKLWAFAH